MPNVLKIRGGEKMQLREGSVLDSKMAQVGSSVRKAVRARCLLGGYF